jgi:DNA polymerase III alpha subunit (gram-positive type)
MALQARQQHQIAEAHYLQQQQIAEAHFMQQQQQQHQLAQQLQQYQQQQLQQQHLQQQQQHHQHQQQHQQQQHQQLQQQLADLHQPELVARVDPPLPNGTDIPYSEPDLQMLSMTSAMFAAMLPDQLNQIINQLLPLANAGHVRAIETLITAVTVAPHLQFQEEILRMLYRGLESVRGVAPVQATETYEQLASDETLDELAADTTSAEPTANVTLAQIDNSP